VAWASAAITQPRVTMGIDALTRLLPVIVNRRGGGGCDFSGGGRRGGTAGYNACDIISISWTLTHGGWRFIVACSRHHKPHLVRLPELLHIRTRTPRIPLQHCACARAHAPHRRSRTCAHAPAHVLLSRRSNIVWARSCRLSPRRRLVRQYHRAV